MIVGVVLAAGEATRFGAPKVVARLRGVAVVRHVVDRLREAGLTELVVVAGDALPEVTEACAGTDARIVRNPHPHHGLSSSLKLGVEASPANADGWLVALGDQPLIDPDVVRALARAWNSSNAAAVVPVYTDGRGNPVLFDGTLRSALLALAGDAGARELLMGLGDRVLRLDVPSEMPRDVDTPEDLRLLQELAT